MGWQTLLSANLNRVLVVAVSGYFSSLVCFGQSTDVGVDSVVSVVSDGGFVVLVPAVACVDLCEFHGGWVILSPNVFD